MSKRQTLLLLLFACSCTGKRPGISHTINRQVIPTIYTLSSSKDLSMKHDTVFLIEKKYSGFLYQLYPGTADTSSLEGYYEGLVSGPCKKWYPNKQVMEERQYHEGKKNGRQVSFWENGNKRFDFIAKDDAYEGALHEWSIDGKLIHSAHFKNGQEAGIQKMWYENGKIRANYVIQDGRRYGLLGTKNCKNVSDSIFVVE